MGSHPLSATDYRGAFTLSLRMVSMQPWPLPSFSLLRLKNSWTNHPYGFASEWIEGQTLKDRLDDETPILYADQLCILRSLADALAACHDQGIIHRNLTPLSVYLSDDNSVKLGDFDFARVSGAGRTISKTGVPMTVNKYTAQEIRGGFRSADARSDLYALGAIWYDLALRRPADEPILLPKVEDAALPDDAKDILRSLLAPQPNKRPGSTKEVSEWLELLA